MRFVKRVFAVQQTPIPVRLLNHGLSQLLRVLDLRVHLEKDRSYVDFSDELKQLSGGGISRLNFSVPLVEDVNLSTLDVKIVAPLHTRRGVVRFGPPFVRLFIQFETSGEEVDTGFVDVDLDKAAFTVDLDLHGHFDSLGQPYGWIRIDPRVNLSIEGTLRDDVFVNLLRIFFIPGHVGSREILEISGIRVISLIKAGIQSAISGFLMNAQMPIGQYLAKGFAQLAGYGHRFYDITSDASNILVKHYDSAEHTPPALSLIEAPHPPDLQDSLAARQINAIGLQNLDKIEHIVVLMQENRSFDHLLGYLTKDKGRTDVEGLTGAESNSAPNRQPVTSRELGSTVFQFDPAHDHEQVLLQIADGEMSGFLSSFIQRFPGEDFRQAMGYYAERHLPTFNLLAEQFLVCDHWFCAHPGPTHPNRLSLLIGGRIPELENFMVDSSVLGFLALPTFFDLLSQQGVDWVYYEQDVAFLRLFDRYRLDDAHVIPFDDPTDGFWIRASNGTLPKVTFVEPNFVDLPPASEANDDHPPADIQRGQQMIGCIYNALIASPQWERMLFVVTYDEHGGFFDHVAPPGTARSTTQMTVPPMHANGPSFYGPRVPAFIVSPWVEPKSVSKTVFDHTSITKTILLKFVKRDSPMIGHTDPTMRSRRMARAAHLGRLLSLDTPRLSVAPVPDIACPPPPRPARRSRPPAAALRADDFHEGMRRFGRPKIQTL